MNFNLRQGGSRLGAMALAATAALSLFGVAAAQAAGVASGPAIPTETNGSTPLTGVIGTQHAFTFKLPFQASCSKDTTSNNYHVFGYIVPSTVDPSTLTFSSAGPSQGFPLVDNTGTGYIAINTAPVTGQVQQPPSLDFFQFTVDGRPAPDGTAAHTLPAGTYNYGVACATNTGQGDRFWNAQITTTAVPTATDPNGFTYQVTQGGIVPESPLAIALPLSAVAIAGIGYFLIRRRRENELVTA